MKGIPIVSVFDALDLMIGFGVLLLALLTLIVELIKIQQKNNR